MGEYQGSIPLQKVACLRSPLSMVIRRQRAAHKEGLFSRE